MTRASEIADYLLGTSIGDTEAAWRAEVKEAIAARWPDVTAEELTAAFQIALVETAAHFAEARAQAVLRAAATHAPHNGAGRLTRR